MPTPTCTKCRRVIPGDDINVAKDVAYCRDCNLSYRLSDLTFGGSDASVAVDPHNPPKGAWYKSDAGSTVIGATNRSLGKALMMLFVVLFWNGIVSIFVSLALTSTLHLLHIPPPVWFPKMNDSNMGLGMTLFLWLFLTPFITLGLFLAGVCLSSLFGHIEVETENMRGTLFTGIGPLGWRRRFDPAQVRDVQIKRTGNNEGADSFVIAIETREGKQLKLGSLLTNERRQFVFGALRRSLVK